MPDQGRRGARARRARRREPALAIPRYRPVRYPAGRQPRLPAVARRARLRHTLAFEAYSPTLGHCDRKPTLAAVAPPSRLARRGFRPLYGTARGSTLSVPRALELWCALIVLTALAGVRLAAESARSTRLEDRFAAKLAAPGDMSVLAPAPWQQDTPGVGSDPNAYAAVDADLARIGEIARFRHRRDGGIPCELGRLEALELNFPASRYALSCDEPVIYTPIETGCSNRAARHICAPTTGWKAASSPGRRATERGLARPRDGLQIYMDTNPRFRYRRSGLRVAVCSAPPGPLRGGEEEKTQDEQGFHHYK